jgi:hypothetical protein
MDRSSGTSVILAVIFAKSWTVNRLSRRSAMQTLRHEHSIWPPPVAHAKTVDGDTKTNPIFNFDRRKLIPVDSRNPIKIPTLIASLAWHPSDRLVAFGTKDGAIILHSFAGWQTKPIGGHTGAVDALHCFQSLPAYLRKVSLTDPMLNIFEGGCQASGDTL